VFFNSDVRFIKLEDIAKEVAEPCIMDIKIGRQTWDPQATLEKRKNEDVSGIMWALSSFGKMLQSSLVNWVFIGFVRCM
jgi:hypothetical protein